MNNLISLATKFEKQAAKKLTDEEKQLVSNTIIPLLGKVDESMQMNYWDKLSKDDAIFIDSLSNLISAINAIQRDYYPLLSQIGVQRNRF